MIGEHTQVGDTIFATPDAPEMSYLTNRRALNGVMYEFFHDGLYDDLESLKRKLDSSQVNLVVVNEHPEFSQPVSAEFRSIVLTDFDLLESVAMGAVGRTIPMYTVYVRRKTFQFAVK